jgi:hypothetical protein
VIGVWRQQVKHRAGLGGGARLLDEDARHLGAGGGTRQTIGDYVQTCALALSIEQQARIESRHSS